MLTDNKKLQEARQQWLIDTVNNLQLDNPTKEVGEKTGYDYSTVSMYLQKKRFASVNFLQRFCNAYKLDFVAINHDLIDKIKKGITGAETKTIPLGGKTPPLKYGDSELNNIGTLQTADSQEKISKTDENQGNNFNQGLHSQNEKLPTMEQELIKITQMALSNAAEDKAIIKLLISKLPDATISGLNLNKQGKKVLDKVK